LTLAASADKAAPEKRRRSSAVLKQTLVAIAGAITLAMTLGAPTSADAQTRLPTAPARDATANTARIERDRATNEDVDRRAGRRPTIPNRGQSLEQSQLAMTAAGSTCQVSDVRYVGQAAGEVTASLFEVDCTSGPGYMVQTTTPPQTFNCVALAAAAERDRAADPNAETAVCELDGNKDVVAAVREIATSAGVTCSIDQAGLAGQNPDGQLVYEVGCAQGDGYWVEGEGATAKLTPCLQVVSQGGTCRFTDASDQASVANGWLAGTEISSCNVQQTRLMGQNANGRFYEVKCAAPDTGYILRLNTENAVQQTYPCATAQRIGGGCTLTVVAAAPAATAPATTQQ
jgi:hypothetical protein